MSLLLETKDLLGKLNVLAAGMKDPYFLTYLLEKTETIASNAIENIHTTVDEAADDLVTHNLVSPYARYRGALKQAHIRLDSLNLIRAHDLEIINNDLRGKKIGFRKTPIKIVKKAKTDKTIHHGVNAQMIPKQIANLIDYINTDHDHLEPVIKSLLVHHEFERIHPFVDGNGRTGRILFAIMLTKYKVLKVPASTFSYSVFQKKESYYQALKAADKDNYQKYLSIMLELFNDSLRVSIAFAKELNQKYLQVEKNVENEIGSSKALQLLPYLFSGVKVSVRYLMKKTQLNNKTITKYLKLLEDLGIVKQEVKGIYRPYKNLVVESIIAKYLN